MWVCSVCRGTEVQFAMWARQTATGDVVLNDPAEEPMFDPESPPREPATTYCQTCDEQGREMHPPLHFVPVAHQRMFAVSHVSYDGKTSLTFHAAPFPEAAVLKAAEGWYEDPVAWAAVLEDLTGLDLDGILAYFANCDEGVAVEPVPVPGPPQPRQSRRVPLPVP